MTEKQVFVWACLVGCPKGMKWPGLLMNEGEVYCNADDAL